MIWGSKPKRQLPYSVAIKIAAAFTLNRSSCQTDFWRELYFCEVCQWFWLSIKFPKASAMDWVILSSQSSTINKNIIPFEAFNFKTQFIGDLKKVFKFIFCRLQSRTKQFWIVISFELLPELLGKFQRFLFFVINDWKTKKLKYDPEPDLPFR